MTFLIRSKHAMFEHKYFLRVNVEKEKIMDNGNTIEKGIAGKIAEAKTIEYAVRRLEEVEKEWDDRMNPNCAWGNAISNLHDKICEEWDKIPANVDLNNQCVELQAKLR